MMDLFRILNTLSKEKLIKCMIEMNSDGWFPIELLMIESSYPFTEDELKSMWRTAYNWAFELEDQRSFDSSSRAASLLGEVSKAIFERAQKMESGEKLCRMLCDDLQRAEEADGIGMYSDSEWLYDRLSAICWTTITAALSMSRRM